MKRWTFATIAALFLLLPLREALRADQVQYTVEDLGTIDGLVPTVTGINASGQVSGFVTFPGDEPRDTRAVRYTNGLGWTYLPGFALGKLTDKGVELGAPIDLPQLNGERAFMRPLIAFTTKFSLESSGSRSRATAFC